MGRWIGAAVMAMVLGATTTVAAQSEPPKENVVYKKRTVITLGEHSIEGGTDRPQVGSIRSRRVSRFPVKLPVRLNFRYEILTSGSRL